MDSSNSQYRARQCFHCEESTVFVCSTCERSLCGPCRTKHIHDLSTAHHETVVYRENLGKINVEESCMVHDEYRCVFYCKTCKLPICYDCYFVHKLRHHTVLPIERAYAEVKNTRSKTISSIRSEDLFYRRALMIKIQSDIKALNTKFVSHKNLSQMFTKADKLKQLIDKVVYERNKCVLILQNQTMGSHIATVQKYEYRYEKAWKKTTQFISFLKKTMANIQFGPNLAQYIHLSLTESINVENMIRLLCAFTLSKGERHLGNESLLELMPNPELQKPLKLTDTFGCLHMSCVRPDQFWVSDNRSNLILFDANGEPNSKITIHDDVHDLTGAHTVNRNNSLIYIDSNKTIMHFSNGNTYTVCQENASSVWIYRCVYSSLLSGNLLIGMSNKDSTCSKVTQYKIDSNCLGHLVQTIQYDNAGTDLYVGPCYITENNNGDIVVSDWKNGVVVTDNGGRHRFTFNQDPSGMVRSQKGICTDPMSHILVCVRHKVMMLDKDGVFLSYILSMPLELMKIANSLSFDFNTHCLWIGSVSDGRVHAFKYLKRPDTLLDE